MSRSPDFRHEDVVPRRPHVVAPSHASIRVVFLVQIYDTTPGTCDAGLSVCITGTCRVLQQAMIDAETWRVRHVGDVVQRLAAAKGDARPITHVIISTPSFIWPNPHHQTESPESIYELATAYPRIEFVQLNHSGMAFISIDHHGMRHIREALDLSLRMPNVMVAGNNPRFRWVQDGLGGRYVLLPNLYDIGSMIEPVTSRRDNDPLRVGSFGAGRVWKNQLTAAEAALVMARRIGRNVQLELYVNSDRWFGHDAKMMEMARKELFDKLPGTKLINVPWQDWASFRREVAQMDVLFSPSFDETFCQIVADGIAEGVPSVVTAAMEWTPKSWQATEPHDPYSIVRIGMNLMHDRIGAVHDGRVALKAHVEQGLKKWLDYLVN
jgi:hypothetical protein